MECLALKSSSIRTEMQAFKEAVSDDCWVFNVAVQNPDDFSVEYLLDFSNEDVFVEELEEEQQDSVFPDKDFTAEENDNVSTTSSTSCMSEKNELEIELAVPADEEDLENLEWLSRFVDDSLSGFNASLPILFTCFKPERRSELECFNTPIPAKSRSKRSRTGGRVWSLTSPPSFSETSSSSSSSTSSIPRKKAMIPATTEGGGSINQPSRRCSHCGVNKTPQWRAGPNGAKTLCNACGVRYKSGRLVPEYRPACSPTFSSGVYSNHHRKVMEIRRKKENPVMISPAGAAPIMLRSF